MLFLNFILIILAIYFGQKFAELAIKIEILRGNISDKNYKLGRYDFYRMPYPIFSEPNDSEEIRKMIKRRSLFIFLFWLCFILFLVLDNIIKFITKI